MSVGRVSIVLVSVLLLGACRERGADSNEAPAASTAAASPAASAAPGAAPAVAAGAGAARGASVASAAGGRDDSTRVQVVMKEWSMEVSRDTVAAGTVIFEFVNGGTEDHELEVELGEREWEGGEVPPGGRGTMKTTLTPGTWLVYCPNASPSAGGSHKMRGQQRLLVVK